MDQYDFGLRSNGSGSDIDHTLCGLNLMTSNMDSFGGGGMPGAISYSKPVVDCPPPEVFKGETDEEDDDTGRKFNSNASNSDVEDERRSLLMGLNRSGVKREVSSSANCDDPSLALSGIVWETNLGMQQGVAGLI